MDYRLEQLYEQFMHQRSKALGWELQFDGKWAAARDAYIAGYKQALKDKEETRLLAVPKKP